MKVFTLEGWDEEIEESYLISVHFSKFCAEEMRKNYVESDANYGESVGYRVKERMLCERNGYQVRVSPDQGASLAHLNKETG
jgi:hypothetical protein